ncbi:helix-turn-helix domain-containing protein [Palleronia abyssalis]|uniref:HTH DNA binding domain-containing protein n=1 Tax=Palleronia abyssalis TaxID=1501240 RepID=A0A2R8BZ99_9RHOB|nr:helix-turn-helix domain-containing protein [Palleronia abyssalis]SPJ25472.1 hypothetical protein PAA8504_03323 [Palleronia abyssalis]
MTDMPIDAVAARIVKIEIAAGRLEGAFASDPALGALWRGQVAITEACRSVGLEDVHLEEEDLVLRSYAGGAVTAETARAGWFAEGVLRVLAHPGDLETDPSGVLARCLDGGRIKDRAGFDRGQLEKLGQRVLERMRTAEGPFPAALGAAILFRGATGGRHPAAERLLFMAVDHAYRSERESRADAEQGAEEILANLSARWIFPPAMALTGDGFRAWFPASPQGQAALLVGLDREMDRALGQLPLLRRWRSDAQALSQSSSGKSKLADLVTLVAQRPILTSAMVADALGVTPRTGLNLLVRLTDAGLMANITGRRTYRAWAPTPIADRLRADRRVPTRRRETVSRPDPKTSLALRASDGPRDRAGEEAALAELDRAMARADAILGKYM